MTRIQGRSGITGDLGRMQPSEEDQFGPAGKNKPHDPFAKEPVKQHSQEPNDKLKPGEKEMNKKEEMKPDQKEKVQSWGKEKPKATVGQDDKRIAEQNSMTRMTVELRRSELQKMLDRDSE